MNVIENNTPQEAMKRVSEHNGFFAAVDSHLSAPVAATCRHCGMKLKTQNIEEYSWPDRRREPKAGLVVQCSRCGSRNQVVVPLPTSAPTPEPGNGTEKRKSPLPKVVGALFALALVLIIVILFINFVQPSNSNENTGNDTTDGRTTVDTDTDGTGDTEIQEDDNDTLADIVSDIISGGDGEDDPDDDDTTMITTEDTLIVSETLSGIGNSFINISEGGMMVVVDEYVYYTNPTDDARIYRMDLNFENAERICGKPAFYLNYANGKLYFAEAVEPYAQYRMNLDGSEIELLNDDRSIFETKIVGDKLYYDDRDDNYALYSSDLDGSNETYITNGVAFYTCITDEHIYYIDTSDERRCYQVDLDGRNKTVLIDSSVSTICLLDDMLYISMQEGGVYRYDTTAEIMEKISDLSVRSLVANTDGWLYFGNKDKDGKLYKMTIDGENVTKLSDDPAVFINVYSNLIAYQNEDSETYYWCLTDGSNLQAID